MLSINLAEKLAAFDGHWQPRVVGRFNGHDLMVVKVKGEFVWRTHEDTDDFLLVLKGRITIRMREGDVSLGPESKGRRPITAT
jgi:mannose-6-phosphate isomerase-like protein (cupin superfamily)